MPARLIERALQHALGFARGYHAFVEQLPREEIAHGRVLVDDLVHLRLGERRLVAFVVSPATVADQIDQEILAEGVAVLDRHAHRGQAAFRIVGIDMHDRNLEALGEIAGVAGRARIAGRGGEADLVVGNDVNGAAGGVAGKRGEIERFGHHALAGEGRIAMDENGHARLVVPHRFARFVGDILRSAHHADHDRIDRLEVARVRRERQRHLDHVTLLSAEQPRAEVVFHVAGELLGRIVLVLLRSPLGALEGSDDGLVRLAEHVGHHVQAAAMGHAEDDFAHAVAGRGQHDLVQHRDEHVGAFDRKALLPQIGLVQEALEAFDIGQAAKERAAGRTLHRLGEALRFRRFGQPGAFHRQMHMIEVEPGRAGVDGAQLLDGVEGR